VEFRSLKGPDDEDGDSKVLAEKKIGDFQPASSYSPNLIRFEYDNHLTDVSPVYDFSDRGKTNYGSGVAPVNILLSHRNVSKVCQ